MAGPSRKVQGGYLGYSALGDSFNKSLDRTRAGQEQRLKQEKLELENEAAIDEQFQLGEAPASQGATGRAKKNPTVVTNSGFNYSANVNDPKLMELIQPAPQDPTDPIAFAQSNYKKNVSQQQKDLFKGTEFSLDGSGLPSGGGFNSALQRALEGLKGNYVKAGRRTSPRKRREERLGIKNQLKALQGFGQEVQALQGSYKQAYDNGLISYGTKAEFIDFLNTVSGPNDLQVEWRDGRGFLVGMSSAGKEVAMPLDNLEGMKNGLVLKQNNPAPVIDKLVAEVNKIVEGVDENGVKTQTNDWTDETANMVSNQVSQLMTDQNSIISLGVDWLGFDGGTWKDKVSADPAGSKQLIVDTLTNHVKTQHKPVVKGGLTQDQFTDNQLAAEKFEETKRRNRVLEGQAQQRINKPTGTKGETSPEDQVTQLNDIKSAIDEINIPANEESFFSTKRPADRVLSKLVGGNIKKARFSAGDKDSREQFPNGYYEVETKGGGVNRIDVADKDLLFQYVAQVQDLDTSLVSNESNSTQSNKADSLRKKYDY